jgi:DNA-3-methyladenine glycosylase
MILMAEVLGGSFYSRDPADVASNLLGKYLIRVIDEKSLESIIVETEAYYGSEDPASRAYHGRKSYNDVMWREPGRLFIYNVHKYWMLNFVSHIENRIGGVLIRALEPVKGIDILLSNRPVKEITELTNGPGKLTQALAIDKSLNGFPAIEKSDPIHVLDNDSELQIVKSHRIGVTRDLSKKLRFFVKDNRFVSK